MFLMILLFGYFQNCKLAFLCIYHTATLYLQKVSESELAPYYFISPTSPLKTPWILLSLAGWFKAHCDRKD